MKIQDELEDEAAAWARRRRREVYMLIIATGVLVAVVAYAFLRWLWKTKLMEPRFPFGLKEKAIVLAVKKGFISLMQGADSVTLPNAPYHLVWPQEGEICTVEYMDGGPDGNYWRIIESHNPE